MKLFKHKPKMAGNNAQSEPTPPTEFDKFQTDIGSHFKEWAASISAKRRPLPDQTGDGTYLPPDDPSILQDIGEGLKDFASLKVTDFHSLFDVMAKGATGAPWDDSKYLMEKLIQVYLTSVVSRYRY
jgi:hypothetical protein